MGEVISLHHLDVHANWLVVTIIEECHVVAGHIASGSKHLVYVRVND